MAKPSLWIAMIVAAALVLGAMWLSDLPLGVPGEWTWARHTVTPDLWGNLLLGLAVGAGYLAFVAAGWRRLAKPSCTRVEEIAWQVGLVIAAGAWLWTVQGTGSTGATVGRWPFVLYYPSSSGYFFKARYEVTDVRKFLRNYEQLMQEGDVLHVDTHPPGLFLFYHGLIRVVKAFPEIVPRVNAAQPAAVRESMDVLQANTLAAMRAKGSFAAPLTSADRAVLWISGLICFLLVVLTVWPLYGFLRQDVDRATSWVCAAAWPLVPAIAIFLPKSDVAYAGLAMTVLWAWRMAWRDGAFGWSAFAGAVWTCGLLCSLAFLPVGLWLAIWSALSLWRGPRAEKRVDELQRIAKTIIPAALMSATILAAVSYWGEISLPKVFWLNYRNHAGYYVQFPKTYLAWLAVNPVELAVATGIPVALVAVAGGWKAFRSPSDSAAARLFPACVATLIVWLWLWLSGKNSGEAARLWIFLMPWLVCACAAFWSPAATTDEARPPLRWPMLWLVCQAVVCLLTVQRVNGFPLP